jgi:uncharacterized protein YcfL
MKKIIFISFILLLAGCVSTMKFSNLDCLRLGMSRSVAAQALSAQPCKTFAMNVDNKNYTIEVYYVMNGEYSAKYFLAYDANGKLIYWGYPNEFERNQNVVLNEIGAEAVRQLG